MLLDTTRESLAFLKGALIISRRCLCSTMGLLFCLVVSAQLASAEESDRELKRVLLLYHSFPTNLVYAKTIRAELERQISIELYDAPLMPASNETAEERYADYLDAHFRDHRPDLVVAIGGGAMTVFRRYRNRLASSTALLALMDEHQIARSNLTANEAAVGSSTNFTAIVENILQVLPETTNVAVVIGNSRGEKRWLDQMRMRSPLSQPVFHSLGSTICRLTIC